METIEYIPKGVCSRKIIIDIENNIIKNLRVIGGCAGNSLGISKLVQNKNINEIINDLQDVKCGMKDTSCPDQIAQALIQYKNKETN